MKIHPISIYSTPRKCVECLKPASNWRFNESLNVGIDKRTRQPIYIDKSSRQPVCIKHSGD